MSEKKYEVVIHNGQEARKYPDGRIRNAHGNIIAITPEAARAQRMHRKDVSHEVAGEGLKQAMETETPEQAWQMIVARITEIAKKSKGRDSILAAKFLGEATGFTSDTKTVEVQGQVNHVPQLPPEYFEALKRIPASVVEAEFEETNDGTA